MDNRKGTRCPGCHWEEVGKDKELQPQPKPTCKKPHFMPATCPQSASVGLGIRPKPQTNVGMEAQRFPGSCPQLVKFCMLMRITTGIQCQSHNKWEGIFMWQTPVSSSFKIYI